MKRTAASSAVVTAAGLRPVWAALVLVAAGAAAYANSLTAPFLFDDFFAIHQNPTIRSLWPLSGMLSPPVDGSGVVGRPVVNLSFALNLALGGLDVRGYHLTNLAIHLLAGLGLFGIVRRTLLRFESAGRVPPNPPRLAPTAPNRRLKDNAPRLSADGFALLVALGWVLHPLQTESVTFVVQRTESLMGLFFLVTLYAFLRALDEPRRHGWAALAFLACLAGMATKEVMVAAPLLVFLYDRTFVGGSFAAAWRERRGQHLALASTWLLLAWLVVRTGGSRGGTSGFGTDISVWHNLLTQAKAIGLYLRLTLWPHPLVVDYGTDVVRSAGAVLVPGILILGVFLLTVHALWRRPVWGFLGAWFFVILAPSSSVVPLATQTIAEHRMYLPLAALIVAGALALQRLAGRASSAVGAVILLLWGGLTVARNADYRSPVGLWEQTVRHAPDNGRAHHNLAQAYYQAGRLAEAVPSLGRALALEATAESHGLLGATLAALGRSEEGLPHAQTAARLEPENATTRSNLGGVLAELGRFDEAAREFREALRLDPGLIEARLGLGTTLARAGHLAEAAELLVAVLEAEPSHPVAHGNLGNVYLQAGRLDEAARHYEEAVRLDPGYAEAFVNLAMTRADQGRTADAVRLVQRALQLQPGLEPARELLARLQGAGARR